MKPKYLVDTSVWIDAYRGKDPDLAARLGSLNKNGLLSTCGVVVTEILQGARSEADMATLTEDFRSLHFFESSSAIFIKAGHLAFQLRKKGQAPSLGDSLIASVAILNNQILLTRDADFQAFPRLRMYVVS